MSGCDSAPARTSSDVRGGEIRGNRIVQGMEGLMLVRGPTVFASGTT